PAESFRLAHTSDYKRGDRAKSTRSVVGEPKGSSAETRGKNFAADDSRTGEESRSKECHQYSQDKDGRRLSRQGIDGHQHRCHQRVEDERGPAPQLISDPTKSCVTRKHSDKV